MNIDEFMKAKERNLHLKQKGFSTLYVRKGRRIINGSDYSKVLVLASLKAQKPGAGAFTNLLNHLRERYPNWGLYVENVFNKQFGRYLIRQGFQSEIYPDQFFDAPTSYFLPPKESK
jgi:hypothetical protein